MTPREPARVLVAELPPIAEWDTATRLRVAAALQNFAAVIREYRGQIENDTEPAVDVVLDLLARWIASLLPAGATAIAVRMAELDEHGRRHVRIHPPPRFDADADDPEPAA